MTETRPSPMRIVIEYNRVVGRRNTGKNYETLGLKDNFGTPSKGWDGKIRLMIRLIKIHV